MNTILIYCDTGHRRGRREKVATFMRGNGPHGQWTEIVPRSGSVLAEQRRRTAGVPTPDDPDAMAAARWQDEAGNRLTDKPGHAQLIVNGKPAGNGQHVDPCMDELYQRYELDCLTCLRRERSATVRVRASTLWGVLDKLVDAGLTEMPLSGLAAAIGQHAN